jgi:lipoate-protein ligase A
VRWNLIVEPHGRTGAENMAQDEALLYEADRSGAAFLRLYRWSPPCLSFGRNEPACARYDRSAIERLGLDVVRRPTGGRAVWHEHELTYAVAAPVAAFGTLRASYRAIHERLAVALRHLGTAAALAADRSASALDEASGACFAKAGRVRASAAWLGVPAAWLDAAGRDPAGSRNRQSSALTAWVRHNPVSHLGPPDRLR